ncbi:MAG: pyruvate formate-lyase activating enzyme [Deltaproteobacteria bacterium]|nr:pyruvate formate-lyase activating enzyme [Deltaproteobacteria bacterium]MBW2136440.1 pyruvate formate-lyase activating enzyme [Deltaproteobacteria bacterium]
MKSILAIDIGAGTMDILYYELESGTHYKAVAQSPVLSLASALEKVPGPILVTGVEMGGGAVAKVLSQRARKSQVLMSVSSAATVHHNLDRVRSMGIQVVGDEEAEDLREGAKYRHIELGDIQFDRLEALVRALGVPFSFHVIGICAQDHGRPPEGISHLDYRHRMFKERLDHAPYPHHLLYRSDEVPQTFNRLNSIALRARSLPAEEVYVMDSGMAAILGASMDPRLQGKDKALVLDVATSHTLGASVLGGEIAGFFEYHTSDITPEKIEDLLVKLCNGQLTHSQILDEGGHGAYIRRPIGFADLETIVATGPKRGILRGTSLPVHLGAPLGDNMMTGAVGLLEAIRRRKGGDPITYE